MGLLSQTSLNAMFEEKKRVARFREQVKISSVDKRLEDVRAEESPVSKKTESKFPSRAVSCCFPVLLDFIFLPTKRIERLTSHSVERLHQSMEVE